MRRIVFALVTLWVAPILLPAQDNAELLNRIKAMEERIRALESEVQALKGQPPPSPIPEPPPPLAQAL